MQPLKEKGSARSTLDKLWAEYPVLQYAFADRTAFEEAWALRALSVVKPFEDLLKDFHTHLAEQREEGRKRLEMVRRPITRKESLPIVQRVGRRLCLWVYAPIGQAEGDISGEIIQQAFEKHADADVAIFRIASVGGEHGELLQMSAAIRRFGKRTIAVVDHYALSAAAYLALWCDRTVIRSNATLMFHRTTMAVNGDVRKLTDTANELRAIDAQMIRSLHQKKHISDIDQLHMAIQTERFFSAEEAFALGLVDAILPPLTNSVELTDSKKTSEVSSEGG